MEASTSQAGREWDEGNERIGYLVISDRPIIPVRLFAYKARNEKTVRQLGNRVKEQLSLWKFCLEWECSNDSSTLQALVDEEVLRERPADPITASITPETLESRIRLYLLAVAKAVESVVAQIGLCSDDQLLMHLMYSCWYLTQLIQEKSHISKHERIIERSISRRIQDKILPLLEPERNDITEWFNFRQICKSRGIHITLGDIAKKTHLTPGYVRQQHSLYQHERRA